MSEFTGALGEPRARSPSPGRGGRFDDGGRRSPLPPSDRWSGNNADRGLSSGSTGNYRARSPDFAGRKRRRDDSPPSRDRYIPNYEREPPRERERRDHPYPSHGHDRPPHHRFGQNMDMFDDSYRRNGAAYRDEPFSFSPDRGPIGRNGSKHARSHLVPPSELPHLVNFRYFAEFMRATSPHIADDKERLAEQWRRYRQDYNHKQLVAFFEENKGRPWFREKYLPGPEFEEMRQRLKKKGREGKMESFVHGLVNGDFDIINYDFLPLSKKFTGVKSSEASDASLANGAKAEAAGDSSNHAPTDLPETSNVEPVTEGSADNPAPAKVVVTQFDNDLKAEDSSHALDAEGEEYEDPDDELSNSAAEAISGANAGVPRSDLGSLIGESMKGKSGVDDIVILPPSANQLFIKSISPDLSREELENHCKQAEGFDYLALSDPHTGKKLHRVGWVSFTPGTDMKAAESVLSESKINNFILHMMRAERPAFQKLRMCPGTMNTPERISKDLSQIRRLAIEFENDYLGVVSGSDDQRGSTAIESKIQAMKDELTRVGNPPSTTEPKRESNGTDTPENCGPPAPEGDLKPSLTDEQSLSIEKKALDSYIYYLRTVFNCCYYCVCVCDFQEELLRRCAKHVRKPAPVNLEESTNTGTPQSARRNGNHGSNQKANEAGWGRLLDERLALLLSRAEVDPRDFGGERVEDEIHRLCQPQITDEGAGKFRCKNCSKLFKAMNFIEKHIISKHSEVINQETVDRIKYLNNYVLDPSHTTPQQPNSPDYPHPRGSNAPPNAVNPSPNMMANMGPPMGGANDFHPGAYPNMMGNSMGGPGGMVMGGPYPGYPPMYAAYPGHSYPPMAAPPMFANGAMMGGPPGGGGPQGPYAPYYMNHMGGPSGYPTPYQHHQVYSALPTIPPMGQGRMSNGSLRRLGDRISRSFADDGFLSVPPHESKRGRRDDLNHRGGMGGNGMMPHGPVSTDPRSKTVLAYNDLDTPAGDEIVLNY